jgi:hypothetical protein
MAVKSDKLIRLASSEKVCPANISIVLRLLNPMQLPYSKQLQEKLVQVF